MNNDAKWAEQKERSSGFWLRIMRVLATKLPRSLVRILLYPIVAFYLLISPKQRRASRHYLNQALGKPANWLDMYRHFFWFAATILDRVYFLTNRTEKFDLTIENLDQLGAKVQQSESQIFVSAHFGSLDALRATSVFYFANSLKVVIKAEQNQTLVNLLNELNPGLSEMLIPNTGVETIFKIHEALEDGISVAILVDRLVADEASLEVDFFDDKVRIPAAIFKLVKRLNLNLTVFFGRYDGANKYHMTSENLEITPEMTLQQIGQLYMQKVEQQCRISPYNWFNFYQYWQ